MNNRFIQIYDSHNANDIIALPYFSAVVDKQFLKEARSEIAIHIASEMAKPTFLIIMSDAQLPEGYLDALDVKFKITANPNELEDAFAKLGVSIIEYLDKNNIALPLPPQPESLTKFFDDFFLNKRGGLLR